MKELGATSDKGCQLRRNQNADAFDAAEDATARG